MDVVSSGPEVVGPEVAGVEVVKISSVVEIGGLVGVSVTPSEVEDGSEEVESGANEVTSRVGDGVTTMGDGVGVAIIEVMKLTVSAIADEEGMTVTVISTGNESVSVPMKSRRSSLLELSTVTEGVMVWAPHTFRTAVSTSRQWKREKRPCKEEEEEAPSAMVNRQRAGRVESEMNLCKRNFFERKYPVEVLTCRYAIRELIWVKR